MADIRELKRKLDLCNDEMIECVKINDSERFSELLKRVSDYKCLIADEILSNGNDVFEEVAEIVDDFYEKG